MNKLDEMWTALAEYQPKADADGHGESWVKMCSEKTVAAGHAAALAVDAHAAVWAASWAAAWAAHAVWAAYDRSAADAAADAAQRAIDHIAKAQAQGETE